VCMVLGGFCCWGKRRKPGRDPRGSGGGVFARPLAVDLSEDSSDSVAVSATPRVNRGVVCLAE